MNYVMAGALVVAVVLAGYLYDWLITDEEKVGRFTISTKHPIRIIEILLILAFWVGATYIGYIFDRAALLVARNERPNIDEVWSPTRFLPYLAVQILLLALFLVSWIVPFAGPLVVSALFLYAPFFVIERRGSGVTSLFRSLGIGSQTGVVGRQILFGFLVLVMSFIATGLYLIGILLAFITEFWNWSSKVQQVGVIALTVIVGIIRLISLSVVRTSAARAYVELSLAGPAE